jgi:16S rRNA (uracil1498-N3)-methyltransferase
MAERYYIEAHLGPGEIALDGPEAHHLAAVCRLRAGAVVVLFNGDGREYPARVMSVGKKQVVLTVERMDSPARELPYRLVAAAPLPKGDRGQVLIEKLTELGATDFVPLSTSRSVIQPRETKLDRLRRHVIEASKQCGRNRLLRVHPLTPWADLLAGSEWPARRVVAHPTGEALPAGQPEPSGVLLAVGPEGGLSDDEVTVARERGWQVVGLGPRILRVETALLALVVGVGQVLSVPGTLVVE